MSIDQIAQILWRRRLAFLATLLGALAAVVAVTLALPPTYSATATLYVGGKVDPDTYVDTSRIEQHTRTYATLAGNPNVATAVAQELGGGIDRGTLLGSTSFAPVERTPLIQIAAEAATPQEAQRRANTYARVFVDRMMGLFATGKAPAELSLSEEAVLPDAPAKPNPPLYIGFGGVLSLLLAIGVVLLRERFDTRVRVAPEDDAIFGEPIVARIPRMDGRGDRTAREAADRFGLLKTNIDFFDESSARVVVVTSPGVSEGKSTISANLALAAAADGERVMLVDADLRRPGLGNTSVADALAPTRVGLSNYLAGAAQEHEIVNTHPQHGNLSVIWAGLIPPNPTALLGSHRLDSLLASLRLDYDRIIIDTCPISVGADASVISSRVDGVLYVLDEHSTKKTEAQAGLNQLRSVRARLLGIVLNRATLAGAEAYYYTSSNGSGKRRDRAAAAVGDGPESFS